MYPVALVRINIVTMQYGFGVLIRLLCLLSLVFVWTRCEMQVGCLERLSVRSRGRPSSEVHGE